MKQAAVSFVHNGAGCTGTDGVPFQFDPERTKARYTGQDIATMIAA